MHEVCKDPRFATSRWRHHMAVAPKTRIPTWNPGKCKHGPKPAVCPSDRLIFSHAQFSNQRYRGPNHPKLTGPFWKTGHHGRHPFHRGPLFELLRFLLRFLNYCFFQDPKASSDVRSPIPGPPAGKDTKAFTLWIRLCATSSGPGPFKPGAGYIHLVGCLFRLCALLEREPKREPNRETEAIVGVPEGPCSALKNPEAKGWLLPAPLLSVHLIRKEMTL